MLLHILIVDTPVEGVPKLLLDGMLQFPETSSHLVDRLFGDDTSDPELVVPGQPHQMRHRFSETFGIYLLDDS
jgi:hypothetical protein